MNNDVIEYDKFFTENYKYLLGFSKSINPNADWESLTHDVYLKCRKRIYLSGFTGSNYLNFTRVSLINTYKTNYRDKKHNVDLHEKTYLVSIENKLINEDEQQKQEIDRDYRVQIINTHAYDYVDKYYGQKQNMIFKTYYVLKHRHLNYKQLAKATGYSITSVSNCIKEIKKDLKANLNCYINTGLRIMELELLLKKIEEILKTDVRQNKQNYMELYLEVFGKHFSGCSCNLANLRENLKTYYNNYNKNLKK